MEIHFAYVREKPSAKFLPPCWGVSLILLVTGWLFLCFQFPNPLREEIGNGGLMLEEDGGAPKASKKPIPHFPPHIYGLLVNVGQKKTEVASLLLPI